MCPPENVDYDQQIMSNYFETMGPIVQGRGFESTDVGSGLVVVANETLVNTFWQAKSDRTTREDVCGDQMPWFTVVGVAKDVKQGGIRRKRDRVVLFLIRPLTFDSAVRESPAP